ncbi:hypothetical protein BDW72DRAFT_209650 [Aspergillus terricola var. indicus]
MSDPLSIAGSIAGLIVLAEELFHLVCKFKDAKEDIQKLSKEIRSLSNAKSRLEKASGRLKDGRVRAAATKLIWPYSEKEVQKLLGEISRHKETMLLALSTDSLKKLLQALSKQSEMSNGIDHLHRKLTEIETRITLNKRRNDILNFFMRYNPQPHFEMSLSLRHPSTGLWLIESPQFKSWLDPSQGGGLWLRGIPGAGKTVLAGSIIEECLRKTSSGSGTAATCFFFCDYKQTQTQDSTSVSALLEVLRTMSEGFDRVFMVIDGLDECGPGSPLARDLCLLVEKAPAISMADMDGRFDQVEIVAHSTDDPEAGTSNSEAGIGRGDSSNID